MFLHCSVCVSLSPRGAPLDHFVPRVNAQNDDLGCPLTPTGPQKLTRTNHIPRKCPLKSLAEHPDDVLEPPGCQVAAERPHFGRFGIHFGSPQAHVFRDASDRLRTSFSLFFCRLLSIFRHGADPSCRRQLGSAPCRRPAARKRVSKQCL